MRKSRALFVAEVAVSDALTDLANLQNTIARAVVSPRRNQHGEFVVRAYNAAGKRMPDSDYFTDDKQDARDTARAMMNQAPLTPCEWCQTTGDCVHRTAIPCGWGCGFRGLIPDVAKHIANTHPVGSPALVIEIQLREACERSARNPVKTPRMAAGRGGK